MIRLRRLRSEIHHSLQKFPCLTVTVHSMNCRDVLQRNKEMDLYIYSGSATTLPYAISTACKNSNHRTVKGSDALLPFQNDSFDMCQAKSTTI